MLKLSDSITELKFCVSPIALTKDPSCSSHDLIGITMSAILVVSFSQQDKLMILDILVKS